MEAAQEETTKDAAEIDKGEQVAEGEKEEPQQLEPHAMKMPELKEALAARNLSTKGEYINGFGGDLRGG